METGESRKYGGYVPHIEGCAYGPPHQMMGENNSEESPPPMSTQATFSSWSRSNTQNLGRTQSNDSLLLECNESMISTGENTGSALVLAPTLALRPRQTPSKFRVQRTQPTLIDESHMFDELDMDDTSGAIGNDTLKYLMQREEPYRPDAHYFLTKQREINWTMRAILIDWMMEVAMEFHLKRETFHLTLNYLDRYLSLVVGVLKHELQLIGVTALFIAAKMEEIYSPKIEEFARSTDGGYTGEEIREMERKMMMSLKYMVCPPTTNMWVQWYMSAWDQYLGNPYTTTHRLLLSIPDPNVVFKSPNQKSYARYRELTQLLDIASLHVATLQYTPRALVASALYILLSYHFGQVTKETIYSTFPYTSHFLSPQFPFNQFFAQFLMQTFGFQLEFLLPTIQYLARFMAIPFDYSLPTSPANNGNHFEEFLAFQTYHPGQLDFIKRMPK